MPGGLGPAFGPTLFPRCPGGGGQEAAAWCPACCVLGGRVCPSSFSTSPSWSPSFLSSSALLPKPPSLRCFSSIFCPLYVPQQQSCELSFIFYFVLKAVIQRGEGNSPRSHSRVSGSQNSSLKGDPWEGHPRAAWILAVRGHRSQAGSCCSVTQAESHTVTLSACLVFPLELPRASLPLPGL